MQIFVITSKMQNFVTDGKMEKSVTTKIPKKHKISYPKIKNRSKTLQFRILKLKIRAQNIKFRHQK